jgi:hypothetical protein
MANIKENKRFHYTYKTTNLINGRYYLGMHSTNRIDDGYLGSGKRLYYELNKYGRNNFKFEILKQFESREELVQAEIGLITEHDLKNPNCLNLKSGGEGGWTDIMRQKALQANKEYWTEEARKEASHILSNRMKEIWKTPVLREQLILSLKNRYRDLPGTFSGKRHSEASIEKMRQSKKNQGKGIENSQYGTCWITDEYSNKKILKGEIIPEGWRLGRKIKI